MNNKKTIIIMTMCIVAMMTIVYAALSSSLKVNVSATPGGGICVSYTCSCSTTTGLTGAAAPSATCNATANTMTATLHQPGDSGTCTFTVKNCSNFRITSSAALSCTSMSSPFIATIDQTINKSTIVAKNGTTTFKIKIAYDTLTTSQPSSTSGTITCSVPWKQV